MLSVRFLAQYRRALKFETFFSNVVSEEFILRSLRAGWVARGEMCEKFRAACNVYECQG